MSQAEQERSQEGREASGSEADAEQVQQFGAVFYITVAISAVAYFSYRRGMTNLQVSTVFRPLLGDRVDGPIAIIATLFGVVVSLGLGTLQIDAGLGEAFGLPSGIGLQLIIIAIAAVAYMLSASTPINKGVNILSQTSMFIAFFLLVYFIVVGPTLLQLNAFTQETGVYLANLVPQSFNMAAFEPQEATWLADWTIFFVAGADAGTIVLGSMSAGGVLNPKRVISTSSGCTP